MTRFWVQGKIITNLHDRIWLRHENQAYTGGGFYMRWFFKQLVNFVITCHI